MKELRRRAAISGLILASFLLATTACVWVGRHAQRPIRAESASAPAIREDAVGRFRTQREELRSRSVGQLNEIIHDPSTDAETVGMARRQLLSIMKAQEDEQRLEGLLAMKGFEDALVTVGDASVNVVLRAEALNRSQTAAILELVLRETGVTAGNVKILSINQ